MRYPLGQKLYFSISEVAELTGLQPYILRTWEKEFTCLRPRRLRGKNRAYRQRDINLILLIKHLLYEERFTIQGVRQKLKNDAGLVKNAVESDGGGGDSGAEGEEGNEIPASPAQEAPSALPEGVSIPVPIPQHSAYPPATPDRDEETINQIRTELKAILRLLA